MRSRRVRILLWAALGAALTMAVIVGAAFWMLTPGRLRGAIEGKLSDRLGLAVTVESISVSFRPKPTLSGTGLVVRMPSRPEDPPFVTVADFWADIGMFSALRGHVGTLHVDGLKVAVPPGEMRETMISNGKMGDVVIDQIVAHEAELTFVQRRPDRGPMVFKIHNLQIDGIGFDRSMPFTVEMTNHLPTGLINATGSIGPWVRGEPAALPISGDYTFTLAHLDTIRGIGGLLTSEGRFKGRLTEIMVDGKTETPDFNLDLGGKPLPLSTTFRAAVNGSDGTVRLDQVNAKLLNTSMKVNGIIENMPGPGRHAIKLAAEVTSGRIEDVLALVIDAPKPMMTGNVRLTSTILLMPGPRRVRDRLRLAGQFALDRGRFTDDAIEAKVRELSRRSRRKSENADTTADPRVFTRMAGRFKLESGLIGLNALAFDVPGARVRLDGSYAVPSSRINLTGTLRMDATVSQAIGGFRSIFLRPFDRLFRRDGAGAVVPIEITGTRTEPKVGLRFGKVLRPGK